LNHSEQLGFWGQTVADRDASTQVQARPIKAIFVILLVAFVTASFLTACGGKRLAKMDVPKFEIPKPPPPTLLVMEATASSRLNLNTDGSAAPLVVRIYELSDAGRFLGSGFFPLYKDDRGALSSDLIARDEIRFVPGETRIIEKTLNPATTTLGVLGAYRSTEQARWRVTVPVIPETTNRLVLDVGARELALTPQP
jgi:type VI secretion system protein VasD